MYKINFLIIVLVTCTDLFAAVSSLGNVHIDANKDGITDLLITPHKIGIGSSSPQASLHVNGNAILQQVSTGTTSAIPSHDLHIQSHYGYTPQIVSANVSIGANSIILVDASASNITLDLPAATNTGRMLHISRLQGQQHISLKAPSDGSGNISNVKGGRSQEGSYLHLGKDSSECKLISYQSKWRVISSAQNFNIDVIDAGQLIGAWPLQTGLLQNFSISDNIAETNLYSSALNIGTFNPGTSFSFSIWIKWDGSNTGILQQILSKRNAWGPNDMMWQFGRSVAGTLKLESASGSTDFGVGISSGVWTHLVLSINTSQQASLYINGSKVVTDSSVTLANGTQSNIVVGAAETAGNEKFYGYLSSLKFYKSSLTDAQVSQIYRLGR